MSPVLPFLANQSVGGRLGPTSDPCSLHGPSVTSSTFIVGELPPPPLQSLTFTRTLAGECPLDITAGVGYDMARLPPSRVTVFEAI